MQLTPIDNVQQNQIVIAKEIQQIESFIQAAQKQKLTLSNGFNQHLLAYQKQYFHKPNSIVYAVAAQVRVSGEQLVLHFCQQANEPQKFYANVPDNQQQQWFLSQLQQQQMVTVFMSTDGQITAISPNKNKQCS